MLNEGVIQLLVFVVSIFEQSNGSRRPSLPALQCSGRTPVMGCQAASEELGRRILFTPALL